MKLGHHTLTYITNFNGQKNVKPNLARNELKLKIRMKYCSKARDLKTKSLFVGTATV